MIENDTYKTIEKASDEVLFKEKSSKFFGYAFPISTEEDVKNQLEIIKKQHPSARHWCYAYQLGTQASTINYRANDDGEPSNSAGMPIYGQLQSFEVTNVLVVVVRYFGGVKLGVGGLISAYKTTAKMALEASNIIQKLINIHYLIRFDYKYMNKVMRIIKEKQLQIVKQTLELDCQIIISVRLKDSEAIFELFETAFEISIEALND